jgi:CubicO group peptidase (beta-lactamase class C family)
MPPLRPLLSPRRRYGVSLRVASLLLAGLFALALHSIAVADSLSTVRAPRLRLREVGLQSSTPEVQGVDSARLAQAIDYLAGQRDRYNIHSLTLLRHGRLILDANFWPSQPNRLHHIASITKAVTSALIGIAIDKGYLAGVHEDVLGFFPGRTIANRTAWKEAITIEHLLTMTSGLGGVLDYEAEVAAMEASPDWLQFALDLPMTEQPGTVWRYSNANTFLLSAIITQTTGMSAHEFARANLLEPLGITSSIWWPPSPQGVTDGSGGLMLAPHDLARFGQLFLQMGTWHGMRVISEAWVATSTSVHFGGFYGYAWGTYPDFGGLYYAPGAKGQRLVVSPRDELVAVFSGGGYANDSVESVYLEVLRSYVFPAVRSPTSLPVNLTAWSELADAARRAASPGREPQPVPPLPAMAAAVTGQRFVIDDNPMGILTCTLTFPGGDEARLRITATGTRTYDDDFEWAAGLDGIENSHRDGSASSRPAPASGWTRRGSSCGSTSWATSSCTD